MIMEYKTIKKLTLNKSERVELDEIYRLADSIKLPENVFYGRTYMQDALIKKLTKSADNGAKLSVLVNRFLHH